MSMTRKGLKWSFTLLLLTLIFMIIPGTLGATLVMLSNVVNLLVVYHNTSSTDYFGKVITKWLIIFSVLIYVGYLVAKYL